ncbi:hypothetical protein NW766_002063 [Fusarium irregulare]|uniref:Histone H4 n=1 Tax=Fusarium irregulare TaxID=2494466 RepID=A0A9W8PYC7_9HYPO|nr:hypothetical protein NW766_002063 [Fusarium irregulare]
MPPSVPTRGGPSSSRPTSSMPRPTYSGGKVTALHRKGVVRPSNTGGKTVLGGKRHRRLARRGGVKRISASIYDEVRAALKARLETILQDCVIYVEYRNAKTVTVQDVIHSLGRLGRPLWGFDPETYYPKKN